MKRFKLYAIVFAIIGIMSCSDDFEPQLLNDLESDVIEFSWQHNTQSFVLESNEQWSVGDYPNWLTVKITDIPNTRAESTFYEPGKKMVVIEAVENEQYEERSVDIIFKSLSGAHFIINIVQQAKPQLKGYWVLSEGYAGSGNSEMAWVDAKTGEVLQKQFFEINDKPLGDTGSALKLYGSKMYAVISGGGFGAETVEGTSYIEVMDTKSGKSIKRIPFLDANGNAAKPRSIIFEKEKAYISSYSNEVVRLDTASLELDAHAKLSGTLAEGLAYDNGYLYVCNSGQGEDNKISVVDVDKMEENKVIETAMNPSGIVSVGEGVLYFNTDYPNYRMYKLDATTTTITPIDGFQVSTMALANNNKTIYTTSFDWDTYEGETNMVNISTDKATKLQLDLESVDINLLMEYKIGAINNSNNIFLSGMGEDIIIFDPATQEIVHALKLGVANASGVVAIYDN